MMLILFNLDPFARNNLGLIWKFWREKIVRRYNLLDSTYNNIFKNSFLYIKSEVRWRNNLAEILVASTVLFFIWFTDGWIWVISEELRLFYADETFTLRSCYFIGIWIWFFEFSRTMFSSRQLLFLILLSRDDFIPAGWRLIYLKRWRFMDKLLVFV